MILEDLSCYSSPLHPMSRQRQQLWLDSEQTSFSTQELNTRVEHCPAGVEMVGYGSGQREGNSDNARCASVVTEDRFCSSECPGSPCAVCRLLGDDVTPSSDYMENSARRQQQQRLKLTRQVEPPSGTPCCTPQHNADAETSTMSADLA